jgi:hypothetical protein
VGIPKEMLPCERTVERSNSRGKTLRLSAYHPRKLTHRYLLVKFDAIFTPDSANSTGRFADVVGGGFRMIANAPHISLGGAPGFTAPFDYTWSGEGSLEFSKGKK